MSIRYMSRVWDTCADVSGTDLLVLLALADFANDEGWAWPSVPTLASKCRSSERTVHRVLRRLEDAGRISGEKRKGRPTRYRLHVHSEVQVEDTTPDTGVTPDNMSPLTQVSSPPLPMVTGAPDIGVTQSVTNRQNTRQLSDDGPTHQQVFDRLAKVCRLEGKLTKAEGGRVAKAAKGIRPVIDSLDDIDAKARAYRRKWPDLDMTPTALEANWSQLDVDRTAGGRPRPPPMEPADDETWLGDIA